MAKRQPPLEWKKKSKKVETTVSTWRVWEASDDSYSVVHCIRKFDQQQKYIAARGVRPFRANYLISEHKKKAAAVKACEADRRTQGE